MISAMGKLFLALVLGLLAWVGYLAYPRSVSRTCPVCLGKGILPAGRVMTYARDQKVYEQKNILCPFCASGQLSLYDLRLGRHNMMKWMVEQQRLDEGELVKRVGEAWGPEGIEELKHSDFQLRQGGKP